MLKYLLLALFIAFVSKANAGWSKAVNGTEGFNEKDFEKANHPYKVHKRLKMTNEWITTKLTPMQYHSTQRRLDDPMGYNGFSDHFDNGTYHWVVCDMGLFNSTSKTGQSQRNLWPHFTETLVELDYVVNSYEDKTWVEVACPNCNSYTGRFYSTDQDLKKKTFLVNSSSLCFEKLTG